MPTFDLAAELRTARNAALVLAQGAAPRGRLVPLPPDPSGAAAQVIEALLGTSGTDVKSALARLAERNRAILDNDNETVLEALAEQLQVLEAIFHRYTLAATESQGINVTGPLQKIAFAAQAAYLRTAMVLAAGLDARRTVVTVNTGGDA